MSFLLYNAPAACNFYGIIRPFRNMNSPYFLDALKLRYKGLPIGDGNA